MADETPEVEAELEDDEIPAAPTPAAVAAAMKGVHQATAVKTNAIPAVSNQCSICQHPQHEEILLAKLRQTTNTEIARTYFAGKKEHTVLNSLTNHFDNHVNINQTLALMPVVQSTLGPQGNPLPLSTQIVFDEALKERINASMVLEKLLVTAMERFNHVEQEFRSMYMQTKCDHCGRGKDDTANLGKLLSVLDNIRKLAVDWVKIKNPREVHKFFFKSTYLKFCDIMTGHYVTTLQEKGRLIRQAVTEFSTGAITHQLLLRRVAEAEDLGAAAVAEKAIVEIRRVTDYIDKEFAKPNWGTSPGASGENE